MDNKSQDDLAVLLIGTGAAPLPKIEEEAVALLVACNSLLNSLALQGAPIPRNLLTDLTIFCRNGIGFGVPFADVAKRAAPMDNCLPEQALDVLGRGLAAHAEDAARLLENEMGVDNAKALLSSFAEMELIRERICGYLGWSRILINARARMLVDEQEAEVLELAKGKLN